MWELRTFFEQLNFFFFLRLGRLGVPTSCLLKGELQGSVNDDRKDNRRKQYQISSHVQRVGRFKDVEFWKDITELFFFSPSRPHIFTVYMLLFMSTIKPISVQVEK